MRSIENCSYFKSCGSKLLPFVHNLSLYSMLYIFVYMDAMTKCQKTMRMTDKCKISIYLFSIGEEREKLNQEIMVVGAFPAVKLAVLAFKQLSKPIANIMKERAKSHPFFRKYICMPPAQCKKHFFLSFTSHSSLFISQIECNIYAIACFSLLSFQSTIGWKSKQKCGLVETNASITFHQGPFIVQKFQII